MVSSRSSFTASTASFILRTTLRSEVRYTFLTYCCVIVEPPWVARRAPHVVVERAPDADRVDAAVLVEVAVLRGEHRLLDHVRDLVERDVGAVLLGAEGGDGVVRTAGLA